MEVISFISFSYLNISSFPQQTSITYKLQEKEKMTERYLLTNQHQMFLLATLCHLNLPCGNDFIIHSFIK